MYIVISEWMLQPKIMQESLGDEEYETDSKQPRMMAAMPCLCADVCTMYITVSEYGPRKPASPVTLAKPRVVVVSRGS